MSIMVESIHLHSLPLLREFPRPAAHDNLGARFADILLHALVRVGLALGRRDSINSGG